MNRLASLCLSLLLAACSTTNALQQRDKYEMAADAAAAAALADGAPGVTIAIAHGGRTVLSKAYGIADLENGVPMRRDSVLRIGSLTKQFTAAAIMQMVEQGKVSLDDSVSKWIPELDTHGKTITIEHLLHHTSGLKNYGDLVPQARRRTPMTIGEIATLLNAQQLDFEPGAKWRYSNTNYFVLGTIIERASGTPYAEYMRTNVLARAGLTSTRYCDDRAIIAKRVRGYTRTKADGVVNADPLDIGYAFAAGGLCSTSEDLIGWQRALTSGSVVAPASYARMIQSDPLSNGKRLNYGFGLLMMPVAGHDAVMHGGGISGFGSFLSWYPKDDLVIAVVYNTDAIDPQAQEERIAKRLLAP